MVSGDLPPLPPLANGTLFIDATGAEGFSIAFSAGMG